CRIAFLVLKDPSWSLLVPQQRMPNDEHVVFLAERHIAIRRGEIVSVRRGMNQSPLQNIFRCNGVELRFDDRQRARIFFEDLPAIEGRADQKVILESVFQARPSLRVRRLRKGDTEEERGGDETDDRSSQDERTTRSQLRRSAMFIDTDVKTDIAP